MNAALELQKASAWCELAQKLSPENQQFVCQWVMQLLEWIKTGKYPPKSSDEVDRKLVAETLKRGTNVTVEKLQLCSFNEVRRNGLRIGTISLSFGDLPRGLDLALAQSFQGSRLIDAIGNKWRKLREESVNSEWVGHVASVVDKVQDAVRAANEQTALRMFDLSQTIGYLLNYFLHFALAGKSDSADYLQETLQIMSQECLPLVHTEDRWIVLVA